MHVPCLSLSLSEVHGKMQDFSFNLHGKNAELGVNSTCHSSGCFSSDESDGRYSLREIAPLKAGGGNSHNAKKKKQIQKHWFSSWCHGNDTGPNKSDFILASALKLGHSF